MLAIIAMPVAGSNPASPILVLRRAGDAGEYLVGLAAFAVSRYQH